MHAAILMLVALSTPDTIPADPCASRAVSRRERIEAFVVVAPARPTAARDTMVSATVCIVGARSSAARIGSYHGELHFDSTAARVLQVVKPAEGMRVENSTRAGQVKFAGAAPTGFADGTFLTVLLRVVTPGSRPALRLQMLELNSTDGDNLMKRLATS